MQELLTMEWQLLKYEKSKSFFSPNESKTIGTYQ